MEFFLQIVLILVCLFYGARKGGVALGLLGGIGLVVMVFAFHLPPGKPPVDVMITIVSSQAPSWRSVSQTRPNWSSTSLIIP